MTDVARSNLPPGIFKLALLNSLCFVSFAIITPVLDPLVREPFGVDNRGTALFMAMHGVATLLFGVIGGLLSDKLGRRVPLIVVGLIGSGAATALIPHIPEFRLLLALRFIDGAFGALALGLLITRALDLPAPDQRNRTMGVMSIAISAGFIAAPLLTAWLGENHLRLLFGLVGGMLILGGAWMSLELGRAETLRPYAGGARAAFLTFYERPRLFIPIVFAFVDKFTFGTLAHLSGLAVADLFGRGPRAASGVILGFWIAFSLVAAPGSSLCDRFGAARVMIAGSILYGLAIAGMGVVNFDAFAALMTLAGAFCAIQYVPSVSLVGEYADSRQRGVTMGVWNMAGSLGIVVGMVASGRLSASSYGLAYGVAGGSEIVCAILGIGALMMLRSENPRRSSA
jgi:MFS family permease